MSPGSPGPDRPSGGPRRRWCRRLAVSLGALGGVAVVAAGGAA